MNLRLSPQASAALAQGAAFIPAEGQLSYRVLPPAGAPLRIQDEEGDFLAWALSEGPQGAGCWVLSRERQAGLDEAWWTEAVSKALQRRRGLSAAGPLRLVHGVADGLPGLLVDEVDGQGFVRIAAWIGEPYAGWIQAALLQLGGLRGLWLLQPDGAWRPSLRAVHSPAKILAQEGLLKQSVELNIEAKVQLPPWPLERRSLRAWLPEAAKGKRIWAHGLERGEPELCAGAQSLTQAPDLFSGLAQAPAQGVDLALLQVPAQAKAAFGRFDARRQSARLLQDLARALAPGAQVVLGSAHASLLSAGGWTSVVQEAGLSWPFVRAFGPEADLPGIVPAAFLFQA